MAKLRHIAISEKVGDTAHGGAGATKAGAATPQLSERELEADRSCMKKPA